MSRNYNNLLQPSPAQIRFKPQIILLLMAKIPSYIPTGTSPYMTPERVKFTLWMKSLLYHSYGCTVFNSKGEIVYRVDNYEKKCSNEVHLMDLRGRILFTIRRRKVRSITLNIMITIIINFQLALSSSFFTRFFSFLLCLVIRLHPFCRNYMLLDVGMAILKRTRIIRALKSKNVAE